MFDRWKYKHFLYNFHLIFVIFVIWLFCKKKEGVVRLLFWSNPNNTLILLYKYQEWPLAFPFIHSAWMASLQVQAVFISYVSMTRPQRAQAIDSTETMYHPILLISSIPLPVSQCRQAGRQACILSLSSAALCLTSDPAWRIRKCQWKHAGSGGVSVLGCWFLALLQTCCSLPTAHHMCFLLL